MIAAETEPHTGNNFDFLRFLLAVLVIFSHSFLLAGQGGQEPLSLLTRRQTYLGEIAVDGFFAISGYLITASWLRSRSVWGYFQKRALRIYPGFLVVSLLCAFIVGPLGADSAAAYFHGFPFFSFLRHALLLDKLDLPPTFLYSAVPGQVNGSLWTIKIEFECYLLVAALGLAQVFRVRQVPLALLVAALGLELLTLAPHARHSLSESAAGHLQFFSAFPVGMVFFLYRDRIVYRPLLLAGAALVLAAGSYFFWLQAILALPLVYVLMYAAFSRSAVLHDFGRKRDLSYGLYLYGWPVQQLLAPYFSGPHSSGPLAPYLLTLTVLPPALACAWASWHFVEKPSLRLKPKPRRVADSPESPVPAPAKT